MDIHSRYAVKKDGETQLSDLRQMKGLQKTTIRK
jgi:hypothetical protein